MRKASISTRIRFEVFKRDGFTCQYCGAKPPAVVLHADHIVPLAEGGPDEMNNLVTACERCNLGKSSVPLSFMPVPLQEHIKKEHERREQMDAMNEAIKSQRQNENDDVRNVSDHIVQLSGYDPAKVSVSVNMENAIRYWMKKLPIEKIKEAATITSAKMPGCRFEFSREVRYFCGVMKHMVLGTYS